MVRKPRAWDVSRSVSAHELDDFVVDFPVADAVHNHVNSGSSSHFRALQCDRVGQHRAPFLCASSTSAESVSGSCWSCRGPCYSASRW